MTKSANKNLLAKLLEKKRAGEANRSTPLGRDLASKFATSGDRSRVTPSWGGRNSSGKPG